VESNLIDSFTINMYKIKWNEGACKEICNISDGIKRDTLSAI